jgi:hypothetical protein
VTIEERVEALRGGLVKLGLVRPGQPLDVLALYCNRCSFTQTFVRGEGEAEGGFLHRFTVVARDWQLGDIFEEADFCPDCAPEMAA